MRKACWLSALGVLIGLAAFATPLAAKVTLPNVFGNHMVLQCQRPIPVWGWADKGENVTVTLDGQAKTATASQDGQWSVTLDAIGPGGPHTLKVQGKGNTIQLSDVLAGEVWLCSGQSNMEMLVRQVGGVDFARIADPQIRMLVAQRNPAGEPQGNCPACWHVSTREALAAEEIPGISAAAYFFGRELHKRLGVPIGLLNTSYGNTPIEAWTGIEAQAAVPELKPIVKDLLRRPGKGQAPRPRADRPSGPIPDYQSPGCLYNGMIVPLAPYAIRGAIWYQGESNAIPTANPRLYGLQLRTMIAQWRGLWGEGDFPFLFVQLPNFKAPQKDPSETDGWPLVREQFLQTLAYPNTGIAVTIDLGEANNVHPRKKEEVGRRLAQWALAKTYHKDVAACGPLYKSMRKEGNRLVVEFDYTCGGLAACGGGPLKGFAIAGADRKFVWAEARIEDNRVVVSSAAVKDPVAARYAWANNPDCNLVNKAGLPASPFRTDRWEK
ncbi:MAG: sialate O-acetylesterase [Thermoguttaceae bacterium]